MPIILIEYGIGRFTKRSTVESYNKLLGPSYRFMGGFQAMVAFALGYDRYAWLLLFINLNELYMLHVPNHMRSDIFIDSMYI